MLLYLFLISGIESNSIAKLVHGNIKQDKEDLCTLDKDLLRRLQSQLWNLFSDQKNYSYGKFRFHWNKADGFAEKSL